MRATSFARALAVLALLLGASPALAQTKVKVAKVYLDGDRIMEGEIESEDADTVTLRTDLGTSAFPRREILHIINYELTYDQLDAKKRAKSTYTSLLLGYKIEKSGAARFKLDPPSPLADVLIRDDKTKSDISISGNVDSNTAPLDDALLEGFTRVTEAQLRINFTDVKRVSSSKTTFKGEPGFFVELTMTKKDNHQEWKQGQTVIRHEGKDIYLGVAAPVAGYDKAKAAYDTALGTFEFTAANPQEGDRLFSRDFLFLLEKPMGWTWKTTPTEGAATAEAEVVAPSGKGSLRVVVRTLDKDLALDAWAKPRFEELSGADLESPKKSAPTSANVCCRRAAAQTTEYGPDSARRARIVYLLKEDDRGYEITTDLPVEVSELQPLSSEALAKFRILNSLLAPGALERGIKAIELSNAGDVKLNDKKYAEAAPLYESAVAEFPRFASAWNNLGLAYLRGRETEKAVHAFAKAYELFPEDPLIKGNVAYGKLAEAFDLLKAKKVEEAARLVDSARSLVPTGNEDMKGYVAALMNAVAIGFMEKENNDRALSWFDKAIALAPGNPTFAKNAGIVCTNAAIAAYNKKSMSSATSWAKRALKYDPTNAKAKQVLDATSKKPH